MDTKLSALTRRIRYDIITSTTAAGSGHPSSSLSAVELMTVLFFGGSPTGEFFKQDILNFQNPLNDKFILSKGHAAPLLYALYEAAGVLTKKELMTLRKFSSRLQGHPTPEVPFVDVTTGSLGQGLSVGVGMALGLQKKFKAPNSNSGIPRVFVLLGDSEFAEGQNYEALQIAGYYKLHNLVGILDVNRLGQRGETQLGWDTETYKKRVEAFGWKTAIIENGNDINEVQKVFHQSLISKHQSPISDHRSPLMIIAKTKKGAGVSFMENADNWHGKPIPKSQLEQALKDIGEVDFSVRGKIMTPAPSTTVGANPNRYEQSSGQQASEGLRVLLGSDEPEMSTREAYGHALANLAKQNGNIIALDAETSNSTYAEFVKKETPDQFVECFIAEQNMISMALGLSKVGYIPFASSFAAFLTRAFDQIRMAQYSVKISLNQLRSAQISKTAELISTDPPSGKADFNQSQPSLTLNIVGSHAGCSIGVDGASQMALEDISMMRSIRESTVLYPSDAVSTAKLTSSLLDRAGISYLRLTREKTPILYEESEEFSIGKLKLFQITNNKLQITSQLQNSNNKFDAVVIAAGITLHEALKAQKIVAQKQMNTIVVDLYSIKPLDSKTLMQLAENTNHIIVVEDHYEAGGIGEAVFCALSNLRSPSFNYQILTTNLQSPTTNLKSPISNHLFTHLCVRKEPRSGTPQELLHFEEIDAETIVNSIL